MKGVMTLAMPTKGLLFDLDGTLLDSAPDLAKAIDDMLREAKLPLAGEQKVREWVGNGALALVRRALAYGKGQREKMIEAHELEHHHDVFLQCYQRCSADFSQLYPGVLAALEQWQQQGIKMAVVTNKPQQFVAPLLERFAIAGFFQLYVGGDTLAEKKPAPLPLLYACKQMGLTVDECVMIGDSRHDVEAARAAGMPVACVNYGYNHGEPIENACPDLLVDSLMGLL